MDNEDEFAVNLGQRAGLSPAGVDKSPEMHGIAGGWVRESESWKSVLDEEGGGVVRQWV